MPDHQPLLFQPIALRGVTARNRIAVSPMCQYSAADGLGDDWHVQTLGAKAAGGAGIVFTEATHVSARGRITPRCLGLWTDEHEALLARLAAVIERSGAVPAIQIAHAGRKGSSHVPWEGGAPLLPENGGWVTEAPSPIGYGAAANTPAELTAADIGRLTAEWAAAARRARRAGFRIAEIHAAHGYLLHEFLSPLSNRRTDGYGRDRARLLDEVIDAVRAEWPDELPLFVRLSCTDWAAGGITPDDTVALARRLRARGDVDLLDCSSGGLVPDQKLPASTPGYQVEFAARIRAEAGIATGAVGRIATPALAAETVDEGRADIVLVGRAVLADPGWPIRAAVELGVPPPLPPQYLRAFT